MAKMGMLKNTHSRVGTHDSQSAGLTIKDIPIGHIEIRENIRKEYTGIEGLADSIRQHGLLQPITVYPIDDNFIVKTGHRRFMAFRLLYQQDKDKFHSIRCIISTADNLAIVQLAENLQREDLSPVDLCNALTALREQGMSNQEIAKAMGKSVGYVNNLFCAVKEIHENQNIAEKTHAGVSLQDIAETKSIPDEQIRLNLLDQRIKGDITRSEMRRKTRKLKASSIADKSDTPVVPVKEHTVKISMTKGGNTVNVVFDCKDNAILFGIEIRKYFAKQKIKVVE